MAFRLVFPASYQKREQNFLARHPDLKARYYKALLLAERDPFHPSLRLHALQGKLAGLHSLSISMRYRITVEIEIRGQEIVFINVGSHGEVYQAS